MGGPPCSLFGFMSSSIHRRSSLRPYGDVSRENVRLSNLIACNAAAFLLAISKVRDIGVVLEQVGSLFLRPLLSGHAWPSQGSPLTGSPGIARHPPSIQEPKDIPGYQGRPTIPRISRDPLGNRWIPKVFPGVPRGPRHIPALSQPLPILPVKH